MVGKRQVQVLAVSSRREIARIRNDTTIEGMAFSPDGRLLATGAHDNTARLFDTSNGKEIAKFSHDGPSTRSVFSPDGKFLATASDDKMARVFLVASGKEIARLAAWGHGVWRAAFSSDGNCWHCLF